MALNLEELKRWPPEIAELAQSAREAADNHTSSADFYRSLTTVSTWDGEGAQAARSAMTATAADHDAVADNLGAATSRMELVHREAEDLAETIKRILDDAAAQPAVVVDESTNQVIPPDTSHMTEEYAARVAAKVIDLQERIATALADGERIDTELAGAITAASEASEPAVKTAGSIEDLLLPPTGERRGELKPGEPSSTPDSLDSAQNQLTGPPGERVSSPKPGEVPAGQLLVDPAKVEEFKRLARETMLRDGVPPEQIEKRLEAIVAAAQKPLPAYKPPGREPMPKPSFADGFADGWFNTEESIKDLVGANGWKDLKDSWTELAKGSWERVTHPIDSLTEEVEHLTKYPEHYAGEVAGETALTAPGAMFGGEAALAARGAGAAIPDGLIDMPSHTGTVEHSTHLGGDSSTPSVVGHSGGNPPHTPTATPLPADSPLFHGYEPAPLGPEFRNPDGSLIYPDSSVSSKPYAVPSTVVANAELPVGTALDRFGHPGGAWLSPDGTPFVERALPPDSATKPYHQYVVNDPTKLPPGYHIEQSKAAPWFDQPGGGIQYRIIGPDGRDAPVQDLLDSQYLKEAGG